jgi:hypothetical protein
MSDDRWFERLAEISEADRPMQSAPARLKSRIYSAVISEMSSTGPLLSLNGSRDAGQRLCVFEHAVALAPVGERLRSANPCRVCHARVLGERLEHAPIFWPGCPYSDFHHG